MNQRAVGSEPDREIAARLYEDLKSGKSKSRIEIDQWGDSTSHGARLTAYILKWLDIVTRKRSNQTLRIEFLEGELDRHDLTLAGDAAPSEWREQLTHAKASALQAVRIWNDPTASFRAGAFALLLVTAWTASRWPSS